MQMKVKPVGIFVDDCGISDGQATAMKCGAGSLSGFNVIAAVCEEFSSVCV